MLQEFLTSRLFHSFTKTFFQEKENNIIVDPLSCLIKLSLLSFQNDGTKISIDKNALNFNEPNILQGTLRYYYGYGREDLHNLYNPIQKSLDWYWIKDNEEINFLFTLATNGLKRLKKSYSPNCTIHHTLDYYISLLQKKTKTKNNDEQNKIHTFLKQLWTQRELIIVIELLKELREKKYKVQTEKKTTHEDFDYLIESILTITSKKEVNLYNFINQHSTIL
jgi:hypothetical protein